MGVTSRRKARNGSGDVAVAARAREEPAPPTPLEELSIVTLARDIEDDDGFVVPAGSSGTIVYVYRDGIAYEVEFVRPFHCVTLVESDAIER